MVISDEIKFPRPIKVDSYKSEKKIDALDGIAPAVRIGAFKKEWQRRKGVERGKREPTFLGFDEERAIRSLIYKINDHLEEQNILIHLVLIKEEDGFTIDVYDCTSGDTCKVIHDIIINVEDVPTLLRNLQQESGILIDTVS